MVGHGGSSAGSYLGDPTSLIPSHCASIVAASTLRVNQVNVSCFRYCFVCVIYITFPFYAMYRTTKALPIPVIQ